MKYTRSDACSAFLNIITLSSWAGLFFFSHTLVERPSRYFCAAYLSQEQTARIARTLQSAFCPYYTQILYFDRRYRGDGLFSSLNVFQKFVENRCHYLIFTCILYKLGTAYDERYKKCITVTVSRDENRMVNGYE